MKYANTLTCKYDSMPQWLPDGTQTFDAGDNAAESAGASRL
jgi:hypothetical protein